MLIAAAALAVTAGLAVTAIIGLGGDGEDGARPAAGEPTGSTSSSQVPESAPPSAKTEGETIKPKPKPSSEPPKNEPGPGTGDPAQGKAAELAAKVAELTNAERAKNGCDPLRVNAKATKAAQYHANDMAERDYFAHDSPEGRSAGDRLDAAGYAWRGWGENIFKGPRTAEDAVRGWMDSPGHRANILNCDFKEIGVGVTLSDNGPFWVQVFGTPA
ncbi:hypothetical protein Afil01_29090 [Actinorhabdospora filicis]|uniref:SCP domain-containing protein n=1 Tax=Actinorhabdospora filicis TaxID=1785913 RepID=A0A9W6SLG5_9ACTN|nr:hypothetical protein Afil01_29090 [Actinorhabdospora filicis]